jgi:hypothetical protein
VIFQRDLEYSLSWSLTIATINTTNCPSLTAPRRAKGFTSPRLLFDTQIAGVVAFLQDYLKRPACELVTCHGIFKRRRLSNSVSAISASLSRPSAIYPDVLCTTNTAWLLDGIAYSSSLRPCDLLSAHASRPRPSHA